MQMPPPLASVLSDRRGASALEFALLALPFILCLLGTLEFARLSFYQASLSNATAAAARFILLDTGSTAATLKQDMAARIFNADPDRLTVTYSEATSDGVVYLTVTASYDFEFMIARLFNTGIPLRNETVVPIL